MSRWELTWVWDLRHEGRALGFGAWARAVVTGRKTPGWLLVDERGRQVAAHIGAFAPNDVRVAEGWANGAVAAATSADVLIEWSEQDGFAPWIGRRWIGRASRITEVLDPSVGPLAGHLSRVWAGWLDAIAPTDDYTAVSAADAHAGTYTVGAFMLTESAARLVVAQRAALAARAGSPITEITRFGDILYITVAAPALAPLLAAELGSALPPVPAGPAPVGLRITPVPPLPGPRPGLEFQLGGGVR